MRVTATDKRLQRSNVPPETHKYSMLNMYSFVSHSYLFISTCIPVTQVLVLVHTNIDYLHTHIVLLERDIFEGIINYVVSWINFEP